MNTMNGKTIGLGLTTVMAAVTAVPLAFADETAYDHYCEYAMRPARVDDPGAETNVRHQVDFTPPPKPAKK